MKKKKILNVTDRYKRCYISWKKFYYILNNFGAIYRCMDFQKMKWMSLGKKYGVKFLTFAHQNLNAYTHV